MRSNVSWRCVPLCAGLILVTTMWASRPAQSALAPREPLARVLGLSPGMPEAQAHGILALLGERLKVEEEMEEDGEIGAEREIWRLRNPRYAWIQIAVDSRHRVKALQAFLRPGGPGLRYDQIGDVEKARRLGYTILEWTVPGRNGRSGRRVTARGGDSVFAGTVAISESE